MTHYNVRYDSTLTLALRDEKALADTVDYMGAVRFATVDKNFRLMDGPLPLEQFSLMLSFAGVSGFPVAAWHRSIWPAAWDGETYKGQ